MSLYNEKEIREQRVSFGFILYVLLTCVVYILPYTKFVVPYIIAALIMLGSLLFVVFKQDEDFALIIFLVFLSVLFSVLIWATGHSLVGSINDGIRNIRFFIPAFWTLYALKYCTQKQKTFFIILFAVLVAFLFIRTSIELERDPWVARILAQGKETSTDEVNAYRLSNVGGFEFSYMMGIITFVFLYAAFKVEKPLLKIIFVILVLLCFNYILSTMYTTLLLLTFIGIVIMLIINVQDKGIKIALILLSLFLLLFSGEIFKFLSTVFPQGSLLSKKFNSLYTALYQEDLTELGDRPKFIIESLNRWIQNPIFGKFDPNAYYSHSFIITILEHTGIVGLLIFGYLFFVMTKKVYDALKNKQLPTNLYIISVIYLVLLSFLNPIGYCFEITIAVYFIVPLLTEFFAQFKKGED